MPADKIETIYGSVLQHGYHNDRIYLMHLHVPHTERLIKTLDEMAIEHGYGKIFAKIPVSCWRGFLAAGYVIEATVPGFFNAKSDGLFIAKFFSEDRRKSSAQIDGQPVNNSLFRDRIDSPSIGVQCCSPEDAKRMADIYRESFNSYAFPIHRPEYIRHMMQKNVAYYCVRVKGEIAALAAAEIDEDSQTCEMTDFATLPEHRGKGFAGNVLDFMETDVSHCGTRTAYTIARVDSPGINRIFKAKGYRFAGRLVKNTQIGGRIRSMNVWYKHLDTGP